jgi:hypothetical protein
VREAGVGSVDIKNPKLAIPRVPKAMTRSDRYGHPRSGNSGDNLIAERELSRSFQDIKAIHVVPVDMRGYAESRAEAGIDRFELR